MVKLTKKVLNWVVIAVFIICSVYHLWSFLETQKRIAKTSEMTTYLLKDIVHLMLTSDKVNEAISEAIAQDWPEKLATIQYHGFLKNLNATDGKGDTLAHRAAKANSPKVLKWLRENGADFGLENNEGETANELIAANPGSSGTT